jgi:hypothetical protein
MRQVALGLFLWLSCATAAFAADPTALSPTDVHYLTTLGQSQADLKASRPTPELLEQLHNAINDPATASKPKVRADSVYRVLDHIQAQFVWCSDHPADKTCGNDKAASAQ